MSYQEIKAWVELVQLSLTPWELESIHHLSAAYADMVMRSRSKDCPAPHELEDKQARAIRINDLIFGKKK